MAAYIGPCKFHFFVVVVILRRGFGNFRCLGALQRMGRRVHVAGVQSGVAG